MGLYRWLLIGVTFVVATILTFQVYVWSDEFKHMFSYQNDWISYVMVFAFVMFLTGVFKWLLKEEIILTDPNRRRRRR
jgi:hypothetical protein